MLWHTYIVIRGGERRDYALLMTILRHHNRVLPRLERAHV
jgi:hypothetical protein